MEEKFKLSGGHPAWGQPVASFHFIPDAICLSRVSLFLGTSIHVWDKRQAEVLRVVIPSWQLRCKALWINLELLIMMKSLRLKFPGTLVEIIYPDSRSPVNVDN